MTQTCGISPDDLRVREGEYPETECPLESGWTFWYDKKTSDKKESDQYMEGLKQLGSFNTIQAFYRHYSHLHRPSEFPRDHNLYLFRKGYKPMWEEFPEGGCWIIRIKRKVAQSYVNHMWENLLLACIGEEFEMPDVVGCVLSTRLKDDVLSVWNLSNRDTPARFRIGEKLKEVLDLDMHALIQYKEHMQSLQDYSTYRNAKNYMFAPSPSTTPMQGTLETPMNTHATPPLGGRDDSDFDQGMLPPAAIDEMLPPAAVDSEGASFPEVSWPMSGGTARRNAGHQQRSARSSPAMSASAAPWSPNVGPAASPPLGALASPALSASAEPWFPGGAEAKGSASAAPKKSPPLSPDAAAWYPPSAASAAPAGGTPLAANAAAAASAGESEGAPPRIKSPPAKSWAAVAATPPTPEISPAAAKPAAPEPPTVIASKNDPAVSPTSVQDQVKSWAAKAAAAAAKPSPPPKAPAK